RELYTPPAPFGGAEGDTEDRKVIQVAVYVYVHLAAIDEAESRGLGRKCRGGKEQQANEAHQYPHGHPSVTKKSECYRHGYFSQFAIGPQGPILLPKAESRPERGADE